MTTGTYTPEHAIRSLCEIVNTSVPLELFHDTYGNMSVGNVETLNEIKLLAQTNSKGKKVQRGVVEWIEQYAGMTSSSAFCHAYMYTYVRIYTCIYVYMHMLNDIHNTTGQNTITSAGDLAYVICELKQIWQWADTRKKPIDIEFFPSKVLYPNQT